MELRAPLLKLPVKFDSDRMLAEIRQFKRHEWRPERFDVEGYWAMNLVSFNGWDSDRQDAPMAESPRLLRCPYIRQVIASFQSVVAEVRVRWLEHAGAVLEHYDNHYLFFRRIRLHLPVTTNRSALFWCDGEKVQMRAGEVWVFDRLRPHSVTNSDDAERIHITLDTVGSPYLWDLIDQASSVRHLRDAKQIRRAKSIRYSPRVDSKILTERKPFEPVASPSEVEYFIEDLLGRWSKWPTSTAKELQIVQRELRAFQQRWWAVWLQHGAAQPGWSTYRKLTEDVFTKLLKMSSAVDSSICSPIFRLASFLNTGAFNPQLASRLRFFDQASDLESPLEIAQEVVFRIRKSGELGISPSSKLIFRRTTIQEIDFLHSIAYGKSPLKASKGIKRRMSRRDIRDLVRRLIQDELVIAAPLELPQNFESRLQNKASPGNSSAGGDTRRIEAPNKSVRYVPERMCLTHDTFVRMSVSGALGLWIPSLSKYKRITLPVIRLLSELGRDNSMERASRRAGLGAKKDIGSLTDLLEQLDVIKRT